MTFGRLEMWMTTKQTVESQNKNTYQPELISPLFPWVTRETRKVADKRVNINGHG